MGERGLSARSLLKFSVNGLALFSEEPLNVPFLYMKINALQESVKTKSTTLLLIGFYQVENIKSETLLNSIKDALG